MQPSAVSEKKVHLNDACSEKESHCEKQPTMKQLDSSFSSFSPSSCSSSATPVLAVFTKQTSSPSDQPRQASVRRAPLPLLSPLRYPGSKRRACRILYDTLDTYFDLKEIQQLVSPFFGGGSFEIFLHKKQKVRVFANDAFEPLVSFWTACKDENAALCARLHETPTPTKEEFKALQKRVALETDRIEIARLFFVLNRCSFSGTTLSGGYSRDAACRAFSPSSIERIASLDLTHFDFSNQDYESFLDQHPDSPSTFLFLDPPYMTRSSQMNLYGHFGNLHRKFDHQRLRDVLQTRKNWMLCYNDCEEVRALYKGFLILPMDWCYTVIHDKKSSEVVILSLPDSHSHSNKF